MKVIPKVHPSPVPTSAAPKAIYKPAIVETVRTLIQGTNFFSLISTKYCIPLAENSESSNMG